jgi:hypothetical protein
MLASGAPLSALRGLVLVTGVWSATPDPEPAVCAHLLPHHGVPCKACTHLIGTAAAAVQADMESPEVAVTSIVLSLPSTPRAPPSSSNAEHRIDLAAWQCPRGVRRR